MHINVTTDSDDNQSRPSSAQVKYGCSYYLDTSHMPCEQGRCCLLQYMKQYIQNATQ